MARASLFPWHGCAGQIVVSAKGPGPLNHMVQIDNGPILIVPCGNLIKESRMQALTWKEFKKAVDEKMKEKSIDENTDIYFIDITMPMGNDDFIVAVNSTMGLVVK